MPVCGSDGPAFAFIEKSNTRYAVTTDISLGQDAFIQFDFSASCSVTNSCYCEYEICFLYCVKFLNNLINSSLNSDYHT